MEEQAKKVDSLIQILTQVNKESDGQQKIFVFALIKEEVLGNERRQVIKCGFSVAVTYEIALGIFYQRYPQFKDFTVVDYLVMSLGENPDIEIKPEQVSVNPEIPSEVKEALDADFNVENIFKLLIVEHTENDHEREVLERIKERIKLNRPKI